MSDETQAGNTSGDTAAADEFKPVTSQEDLNRIITDRVNREKAKYADYTALKQKATQFDDLQAAQQSESERLTARATQAEERAIKAELAAVRSEIAVDKGLTPAQAKRLVGNTREELEADAADLLETFKPATTEQDNTAQVSAALDLGTRGTTAAAGEPAADFAKFLQREMNGR